MKKIRFSFLIKDLNFDTPTFIDIIIENKKLYYEFLKYCYYLFVGSEKFIFLQKDDIELDNEKHICFVHNLLNLELNTKKNINALYKILKQEYYKDLKEDLTELNNKAKEIIKKISMDFDVELYSNLEIKEDDIFKLFDLRLYDNEEGALKDKIIKYCSLVFELQRIDIFIFVNMHQFLDDNELESIYKELSYSGIKIINVENIDLNQSNNYSNKYIVDKELCLID